MKSVASQEKLSKKKGNKMHTMKQKGQLQNNTIFTELFIY
jgi:hypothetical protein